MKNLKRKMQNEKVKMPIPARQWVWGVGLAGGQN